MERWRPCEGISGRDASLECKYLRAFQPSVLTDLEEFWIAQHTPRNVAAPEILLPTPLRNRALVDVATVMASSTPFTIPLRCWLPAPRPVRMRPSMPTSTMSTAEQRAASRDRRTVGTCRTAGRTRVGTGSEQVSGHGRLGDD